MASLRSFFMILALTAFASGSAYAQDLSCSGLNDAFYKSGAKDAWKSAYNCNQAKINTYQATLNTLKKTGSEEGFNKDSGATVSAHYVVDLVSVQDLSSGKEYYESALKGSMNQSCTEQMTAFYNTWTAESWKAAYDCNEQVLRAYKGHGTELVRLSQQAQGQTVTAGKLTKKDKEVDPCLNLASKDAKAKAIEASKESNRLRKRATVLYASAKDHAGYLAAVQTDKDAGVKQREASVYLSCVAKRPAKAKNPEQSGAVASACSIDVNAITASAPWALDSEVRKVVARFP